MTISQPANIYRQRIYGAYVSGRNEALAPESVDGLAPRLPYLRWLVRTCMPADRAAAILDIGCGHGAILYALQQAGYRNARGVDGSAEQVQAAARLGIAGVQQGDLMQALCDTADASLDVVIAFDVIEHFTKAELIPLVDEVHRVLRPGGRWIIHAPNGESPFGNRMRCWDYTHEQAFTRTSLGQLLLASGFLRVEAYEDRPVPHGFTSTVRAALWRLIRRALLFYIAVETGSLDRRAVFSQNLLAVAWKAA
ncbi:MAG: methyltransferase domain-containing protein [Metallibacterium scheffleri]|jgi:SAM-dependent methyltransferase|uniref:class I SAM-dependent methyltransferase n=1 Tax=Metallibacterium scheffleri TaxID=993689 RepID=UPI0026F23699|nr:class I SAM-dependent methyltransferase [Metallibacterium scheffleri]MCK9367474.1 methyltransferase domain-containing protein [Metallibacterium scheffleri]